MCNLNEVTLIGRLGQTPKIIKEEGGKPSFVVCSLATNEYWKHDDIRHSHTEWHLVQIGAPIATFVVEHCDVGDEVFVRGRLRTRKTEKDGVKYSMTAIKADSFQLLRKKAETETLPKEDKRCEADSSDDSSEANSNWDEVI